MRRLPLLLLPLLLLCLLAACGDAEGSTGETTATTTAVTSLTVTTATDPARPAPSPTEFRVTLDPGNGLPPTVLTLPSEARTVPLPTREPQKSGEQFLGWFYEDGTPYHGEIVVRDLSLTAQYAKTVHTVTFAVPAGAEATFTATRVASGAALTDLPHVFFDNAVADGWYLDSDLTVAYAGQPITEALTLYPSYRSFLSELESTIPAIHITTVGGAPILSKEDYVNGTITVTGTDEGDPLTGAGVRIRGRGNSTWKYFDKKPYRLKLDAAADLCGIGRERDFVLLANAGDPTLLHNTLFFDTAHLLGDTVTSDYCYVSLYLNGTYEGLYLLCEQNEAGDGRVPIDDGESGETDVGYLVEFGGNAADPERYGFTLPPVRVGDGVRGWRSFFVATVKSPDEDVLTPAQAAFITDYTRRVNTAIFTGDFATFTALCDLDSFVSGFITNMVLLNNDMDFSLYFYKPAGGKLCLGPLWDADQAAGTSAKTGTTAEGFYVSRYDHWLTALWEMEGFRAAVRDAWETHRQELFSLPNQMLATASLLRNDIDRNYLRHGTLGKPYWRQCPAHLSYTSYDEHLDFFIEWLLARLAWLDVAILGE